MSADTDALRAVARQVGDDWRGAPYFQDAEPLFDGQWEQYIWPMIHDADFSAVVDLAAGHGRNSTKLVRLAQALTIVDINEENVTACRRRFASETVVTYATTDGTSIPVPDRSQSLVYCFDAMVHFDSDIVRAYLRDARRVLKPGGRGFCHHSNFTGNPMGDVHENGGWRNFMSQELFAHFCHQEGLRVLRQRVVDWGKRAESDCLTVFEQSDTLSPADEFQQSSRAHAPSAERALEDAARFRAESRWPDVAAACARAASLAPTMAQAHARRAEALLAIGRRSDAAASAARALRLDAAEAVALDVERRLAGESS